MSDSLWPQGQEHPSLLCPWNFPGKNTGVGCHLLLQEFFIIPKKKKSVDWTSSIFFSLPMPWCAHHSFRTPDLKSKLLGRGAKLKFMPHGPNPIRGRFQTGWLRLYPITPAQKCQALSQTWHHGHRWHSHQTNKAFLDLLALCPRRWKTHAGQTQATLVFLK